VGKGKMRREGEFLFLGFILFLFFLIIFLFVDFNGAKNVKEFLTNKVFSIGKKEEVKLEEDEVLFKKITVSFELKDFVKVRELANEFLLKFPDSKLVKGVYYYVGYVFYEEKDLEKAKEFFKKAISKGGEISTERKIEIIKLLGNISRTEERYDSFVLAFLEDVIVNEKVEDSTLFVLLGYQYLYAKLYDKALVAFEEANSSDGIIGLARVNIEKGNYTEAINNYLKYFNYPGVDSKSQQYARVKEAFLKQTLYYANRLFEAKKYDEAISNYATIYNLFINEKESDEALVKSAIIFLEKKEYEKSLECLKKAIVNIPKNCDELAMYYTAVVYYNMGKKKESYQTFCNFLSVFPSSDRAKEAEEWKILIRKELGI
jgi:tetratricopeptide (TPR) repeat protein